MASSRPRAAARSTSLRESDAPLEGAAGWEALEWTKIEVSPHFLGIFLDWIWLLFGFLIGFGLVWFVCLFVCWQTFTRSFSFGNLDCLLEAEQIVAEVRSCESV